MAPQALAQSTQERPSPGLVSVDGRVYPLRSAHIRARAEGGLAAATLVQEFHNPYDEPLEVAYAMPLPADGAVLGYTITMGERIIRGEIEVREKAEARYRKALYEGRTAGLLEQDRPDTFQQRLGNVPARTDVRVEIDVLQPLAFLAGTGVAGAPGPGTAGAATTAGALLWEFRFPTVVGVRYEGAPGRVPDARRLDVDRDVEGAVPTRFGLSLTVADESAGPGEISSPSHELITAGSVEGASVRLREDARLDRDLVVRWAATTPAVGVRVVEGCGLGGDNGRYALVTITPPAAPRAAYRRDLTVLIDSSGSMSGRPIELAKRMVGALLEGLGPEDRFEILSFSNSVERLTRGAVPATAEAIERAVRDVRGIEAGGGTEMTHALGEALRTLRTDSQRQVVLVSDGEIGFEHEVLGKVRNIPAGVRIHVVGIGVAPNRSLTRFLARAGRGVELIAGDDATATECAVRLRAATDRPVLTDLRIGGSALRGLAPAKPRDVLAGQPLLVAAELKAQGGTLEVAGNLAGSTEAWGWRVEIPASTAPGALGAAAAVTDSPAIARTPLPIGALYGRETIADLEAETGPDGLPAEEIDRRITAIGLRHRITSRRTSLVAICEEPTTDPTAPRRRERLPVELPAGVSAEGVGLLGSGDMMMLVRLRGSMLTGPPTASLERGMRPMAGLPTEGLPPKRAMWLGEAETLRPARAGGHVLQGAVIHRDGGEIVLEFEVPEDGYTLPSGVATITVGGRKIGSARTVAEKSTAPGPHPRGVWVRLALRMEGGVAWPDRAAIEFKPKGARSILPGLRRRDGVTILFEAGPAGGAPHGPARDDPPVA